MELRELARQLLPVIERGEVPDEQKILDIEVLLKKLLPIEKLWGFPGKRTFMGLTELFADGEYRTFSRAVIKISHMVLSQTYRHTRWVRHSFPRIERFVNDIFLPLFKSATKEAATLVSFSNGKPVKHPNRVEFESEG